MNWLPRALFPPRVLLNSLSPLASSQISTLATMTQPSNTLAIAPQRAMNPMVATPLAQQFSQMRLLHVNLPSSIPPPFPERKRKSLLWYMWSRDGPPLHAPQRNKPISGHHFHKGIILKLLIRHPKKPNSGNRKCAQVRLSNGKVVISYIPGVGHNLQEHSKVLVAGARRRDLIGVRSIIIRGKLDASRAKLRRCEKRKLKKEWWRD